MIKDTIHIRRFRQQAYDACWQAMRTFTDQRDENTVDEIWLVEHPPVFTLGQNGKTEHILNAGEIPVINADRGGQVTYHGPGQLMLYTLIDIKRRKMTIRDFVCCLEKAVIAYLKSEGITAYGKRDAPGVYISDAVHNEKKICSIGLRVRRGATYHGIAFNIAMDLTPFDRINPCGFSGLKMTQLIDEAPTANHDLKTVGLKLSAQLTQQLGYTSSLLD